MFFSVTIGTNIGTTKNPLEVIKVFLMYDLLF